jgi:DNA mismatch endonuclease (patch repair protein)
MGKSPPTDDIKRRYIMSRIKNKNTSIEISLRRALWRAGIRFRKNYRGLPGTPDIAITKDRIAVFCDGDFWHGKDWGLKKGKLKSNRDYWVRKIERNINRDRETELMLNYMGWTVLRFWGSEIRRDTQGCVEGIRDAVFQKRMERYIEALEGDGPS